MVFLVTNPFRLLTPALSSFGEERENYFVGRLPGVGARRHRTNPGLIAFAPLGQVSFRLRQTSARSFESAFISVNLRLRFFAPSR